MDPEQPQPVRPQAKAHFRMGAVLYFLATQSSLIHIADLCFECTDSVLIKLTKSQSGGVEMNSLRGTKQSQSALDGIFFRKILHRTDETGDSTGIRTFLLIQIHLQRVPYEPNL